MIDFDGLVRFIKSPEGAGTLGSLLSLRWAPGNSWTARAFAFGGGLGMSFYGAPFVAGYFSLTTDGGKALAAFLLGTLGANILAKVVDYISTGEWLDALLKIRGSK